MTYKHLPTIHFLRKCNQYHENNREINFWNRKLWNVLQVHVLACRFGETVAQRVFFIFLAIVVGSGAMLCLHFLFMNCQS